MGGDVVGEGLTWQRNHASWYGFDSRGSLAAHVVPRADWKYDGGRIVVTGQ